jgi:recombinational DNA repair protein (RecF pathway)
MQGFIIDIKNIKDEDLIVTILTNSYIYTTYRFYGARHSTINLGYKIDFELESNMKSSIPRLKDVLQLGFSWILDKQKLYFWQNYLKLFATHLRGIENIESFYFDMFEELIKKIDKQNPKRAIIESYTKLLEYEGRLHNEYECLLCEKHITNNISLVRSFVPTHSKCSYSKSFTKLQIEKLFETNSTLLLSDEECDYLFAILLQGL